MKSIKKKLAQGIIFSACLLICFEMTFVYKSLFTNETKTSPSGLLSDYSAITYYKINPETILKSINQGETNVFHPLAVTLPHDSEILYGSPFPWDQSDYLKVTTALYQYAWHETPSDWNIYFLGFYGDCKYDPIGFDIFRITYFKSIGIERHATREIQIYPLTGEAATGEGASFPRLSLLFGWKTADPSKFIVTASNALKLAEEKGGIKFRQSINNECRIFVDFMPNGPKKWIVRYSPNERGQPDFEVSVDPFTGDYEIQSKK